LQSKAGDPASWNRQTSRNPEGEIMPITIEVIPIALREFSEVLLALRAVQKLPSDQSLYQAREQTWTRED
jgi:hypothetical protein